MKQEQNTEIAKLENEEQRNSEDLKYLREKIDNLASKEARAYVTFLGLVITLIGSASWGILNYTTEANERAEAAILRIEERASRSIGIAESYIERFEDDTKPTRVFFQGRSQNPNDGVPMIFSVSSIWNDGLSYFELQGRTVLHVNTESYPTKYLGSNFKFGGQIIEAFATKVDEDGGFNRRNFVIEKFQPEGDTGVSIHPGSNFPVNFTIKIPSKDCDQLVDEVQRLIDESAFGRLSVTPVVAETDVPIEQQNFDLIPYLRTQFTCEELKRNYSQKLKAYYGEAFSSSTDE